MDMKKATVKLSDIHRTQRGCRHLFREAWAPLLEKGGQSPCLCHRIVWSFLQNLCVPPQRPSGGLVLCLSIVLTYPLGGGVTWCTSLAWVILSLPVWTYPAGGGVSWCTSTAWVILSHPVLICPAGGKVSWCISSAWAILSLPVTHCRCNQDSKQSKQPQLGGMPNCSNL